MDWHEAKLFAPCSLFVTFCSLLVTFCSLLVSFCLLLVTFCSLLITFCSLLVIFCSLLVTFISLLVTFCSLLVTFCSLPVIFSSKLLWNKVTVNCKKWFDYNEIPPQILSLQFSVILVTFSIWWFPKFSQHAKPFSKLK